MSSSYFEKLILQARELDVGTAKLSETWKLPKILIGGFTERTEETDAHIETIWKTIRATQDGIRQNLSEMKSGESDDSIGIQPLLQEVTESYNEIKGLCNDFESVLAENGYQYNEADKTFKVSKDSSPDKDSSNANSSAESDHHDTTNMNNTELEFTPNLGCRRKVNVTKALVQPENENQKQCTTPVVSNLCNTLKQKVTITDSERTMFTPVRERPQEPVYSKHFYNIQKKQTENMTEQL